MCLVTIRKALELYASALVGTLRPAGHCVSLMCSLLIHLVGNSFDLGVFHISPSAEQEMRHLPIMPHV